MRTRLRRDERRQLILEAMRSLHRRAENQDDFTGKLVAKEAGVTRQLVHRYAQREFAEMRSRLPGSIKAPGDVIRLLRAEADRLRAENETLRAIDSGNFVARETYEQLVTLNEELEQRLSEAERRAEMYRRQRNATDPYIEVPGRGAARPDSGITVLPPGE